MIQRGLITVFSLTVLISCKAVDESAQKQQFDGEWKGEGFIELVSKGQTKNCPRVTYRVEHTPASLILKRRSLHCLGVSKILPEVRFDIRNSDIYFRNVKVGNLISSEKDQSAVIAYRANGVREDYISLSLEQDHLFVVEEHFIANEQVQVSMDLQLTETEDAHLKQAVQKFLGLSPAARSIPSRDR